ncbi:MAG: VanW family protein [Bacteroidales bacterium]|nr:VanW family protein [Candidatus Physcousia equi]
MKQATKARLRGLYVKMMDLLRGTPFASQHLPEEASLPHALALTQPFMPSATLESKKHNLREAAARINTLVIRPGEVFSFWHAVGNPNNRGRFREGRSIHQGKVHLDVGGGLCQASGIIYHLALISGLEVVERHNHSVDLYTDDTRFAPLGSDATVFYGFKDLRLRNNLSHPIQFQLQVGDTQFRAFLRSDAPLDPLPLHFDIKEMPDGTKHVTISAPTGVCSRSVYRV